MSQAEILAKLAAGDITAEQAGHLLEQLNEKPLTISITDKGGVSVKGIWRFPVTLYPRGWERIAEVMPQILAKCAEVPAVLKRDPDQAEAEDIAELTDEAA